jgi:hypothetical protein
VVLQKGKVRRTPPILKYMIGWSALRVLDYATSKGWKAERVRK